MKKDYAVNIRLAGSDSDWDTADMADWYASYEKAFEEAEKAFEDAEVLEVSLSVWAGGEIDGNPLHMIRENGIIVQYQGGHRLWA